VTVDELLATALYKPGDVVTTNGTVNVFDNRQRAAGGALPGWKWRITAVTVVATGCGLSLRYAVVADSAPQMYSATLRAKNIARKYDRSQTKHEM
jgi:hypothetical protein